MGAVASFIATGLSALGSDVMLAVGSNYMRLTSALVALYNVVVIEGNI